MREVNVRIIIVIIIITYVDICYNKGAELNIIFNAEKSCLCKISSKVFKKQIDELVIGQQVVKWVDRFKYLGLYFCCQKQLTVDSAPARSLLFFVVDSVCLYVCL